MCNRGEVRCTSPQFTFYFMRITIFSFFSLLLFLVLGQEVFALVPDYPINQEMIDKLPSIDEFVPQTIYIGGNNPALGGSFTEYNLVFTRKLAWGGDLNNVNTNELRGFYPLGNTVFFIQHGTTFLGANCEENSFEEKCYGWDNNAKKWVRKYGFDVRTRADFNHQYFWSNRKIFLRGNNNPDLTNGQYPTFNDGDMMYEPDTGIPSVGQWISDSYRIVWQNRNYFASSLGKNGYYVKLQPNSHYTFTFFHFFPQGTRDITAIQYRACLYDTDVICSDEGIFLDKNVNEYGVVYDNMVFAPWELDTSNIGDRWTWRIATLAKVGDQWGEFSHVNLYIEISEDGVPPNGSLVDEEIANAQAQIEKDQGFFAIFERSFIRAMSLLFVPSDHFFEQQLSQIVAERDRKLGFYVAIKNSFNDKVTSMTTATAPPLLPKLSLYGATVDVMDVRLLDPHIARIRGLISAFLWVFLSVFIIKKVSTVIRS